MKPGERDPKIALVGPCSSGKSTLRRELREAGYPNIVNPAQEHSYVADMWERISRPDILIYLDVDYPTTRARRPHEDRGEAGVAEQKRRLLHARQHADFYIDTSGLTLAEIAREVLAFLESFLTKD